jgi:hypothetical protein
MGFPAEKETEWPGLTATRVPSKSKAPKRQNPKSTLEPCLEISPTALDADTLRGLIDEWLIEAMVNRYIRERLETVPREHNGRQP